MSERFDDLAVSLASENPLARRSMIRSVLAAMGLGAGAVLTRQNPVAAAPPTKSVTCPAGLSVCGTVCRDLTSSNANCGACGNACAADSVCRNGTCVRVDCTCAPTCPTGLTWCGACVNTATDAANCGACGNVCPTGQICSNGTCRTPPQCTTGADCPGSDTICSTRTCTNGICGVAYAPATTVCSPPNGFCDGNGVCAGACPPGFTACNGACVDLASDVTNCGTCGHPCAFGPNSQPRCDGGVCRLTCAAGFEDCDGNLGNGCETNISSVNSCGACGNVCPSGPNSIAVCNAGTCGFVCNAGFADCDGNPATGCEANLSAVSSCGACGNVCPSGPNSFAVCNGGTCGLVCASGFANCDGNPSNGCEVNITNSNAHCGACGNSCPPGTTCSNGNCVCVPRTCAELGVQCGSVSNGCGGTINCGTCSSGLLCVGGVCQ